jgi:hypothetical protein
LPVFLPNVFAKSVTSFYGIGLKSFPVASLRMVEACFIFIVVRSSRYFLGQNVPYFCVKIHNYFKLFFSFYPPRLWYKLGYTIG